MEQSDLRQAAIKELERLYAALPCGNSCPELAWNPRMRSTAGRYHPQHHRIELNPRLLTDECRLLRTLGHEYAHAVAIPRAPREPSHGPTWQAVMEELGLEPRARHAYDTSQLRRKPRVLKLYECPACNIQWKVQRRYPHTAFHPCRANTKRTRLRLVAVIHADDVKQG